MNEKLTKERIYFTTALLNKSNEDKKLYHYKSVINLSNGLISLNDSSSHYYFKEQMFDYFNLIKDSNYLISQKESLMLYKKYILPIGQHLIKNNGFRTRSDIFKYIFVGVVLDFSIFFFLEKYYFIMTPILFFIGYHKRKNKIKQNKFFSVFW
ncbi:hypothetical protein [Winogradskyella sp.]|uniref:hypothetical protein n=1 Tax=Winogradskyella sp. TaxID=1883156 RepID=UPI001B0B38A9|nr:hypothetical protein [Winogradskyella sp.]MBO6881931.1 hypothetical protein [Winogradskyella sp.]